MINSLQDFTTSVNFFDIFVVVIVIYNVIQSFVKGFFSSNGVALGSTPHQLTLVNFESSVLVAIRQNTYREKLFLVSPQV